MVTVCSSQFATRYTRFHFFFSSRRRHTRFDCDWSSDVCSSDLASAGLAAPTSCHHLEFVEPALECSVPERRTGRGLEADQLGQAQVGGEDIAAPAGEFFLQRVAQLGVEARQLLFASRSEEHTSELQSQSN